MSRQILIRFKPDKKSAALRQKTGKCAVALINTYTGADSGVVDWAAHHPLLEKQK